MTVGLISSTCSLCGNQTLRFQFVKDRPFPKTYCYTCSRNVPSCRNGSIFDRLNILLIPTSIFIVNSFVVNMTIDAITTMAGIDVMTTRRYLWVIRDAMTRVVKELYRQWEGQLGGPGKVIEIDEAFLAKRKYGVGRIPKKGNMLVFGITERDGGPT